MTGTKYTDLEKGETDQLTTNEIKESDQKYRLFVR